MASRFEIFSIDEIEAVVQTNTKKSTIFDLPFFAGKWKIIFMLNLQQNRKNAVDQVTFLICRKLLFFIFIQLIW